MLVAGSTIDGRYRLVSLIGEGGMASVWRAEDDNLKRAVAIKLLYLPPHRDPSAAVEQFLREARIAAAVQHRNVVHTMDFGTTEEGIPYMVMELLHGESLADRMDREPRLRIDEWVRLAEMTLRGLAAVHEAGIVHRDLKPQNIFLQRDADAVYPKILDFGISRSLTAGQLASPIATQQGYVLGTPHYMSPEQARGETQIDQRADIYSIGTILYEAMAGRLPYDADSTAELLVKIVTSAPVPLRELCPPGTEPIADTIAQGMAAAREQRFADARTFRRALQRAYEQCFATSQVATYSEIPLQSSPVPGGATLALPKPAPHNDIRMASWGDFEGLTGRPPPDVREEELAVAHTIATDSQPVARQTKRRTQPEVSARSSAVSAEASIEPERREQPMFGDNPLDAFAGSAAVSLELDYAPWQERQTPDAGRKSRKSVEAHTRPGRSPAPAAPAAAPARPANVQARVSLAWWFLPAILAALLGIGWLAPGLFSMAPPDQEQAQAREASSAATRGSARVLRRAPPAVYPAALPQERELLE